MTLLEQIDELAKLETNWDGYGALPIKFEIIGVAKSLARRMPPSVRDAATAVPMSDGRMQFEWHDRGRSLELEVSSPTIVRYLMCPEKDSSTWSEADVPVSDIAAFARLWEWWTTGSVTG